MEWLKKLGKAIDYIEDNLDKEISYDEAARIACCSPYYFQRVFSYVSGVSLAEYIRRRKMTQAAFELQRADSRVIDVSLKYGYTSPTSFNRAFQNVHGITLVMTSLDKIQAGFNSCFIVRYLLEKAGNTEQAVSLLMQLPIASNCNILLADKSGDMKVVECTPSMKKIRDAESFENGRIICTVNSFTSDEMKQYDDANGDDYNSHKRYQVVMDSFASGRIKEDYIETTKQLLKGDYGFMCQYDNEPDFETVWSSVFDLESLIVYRAEGDPRKKKFMMDNRLHDLKMRGQAVVKKH